jgi:hypothetical protein
VPPIPTSGIYVDSPIATAAIAPAGVAGAPVAPVATADGWDMTPEDDDVDDIQLDVDIALLPPPVAKGDAKGKGAAKGKDAAPPPPPEATPPAGDAGSGGGRGALLAAINSNRVEPENLPVDSAPSAAAEQPAGKGKSVGKGEGEGKSKSEGKGKGNGKGKGEGAASQYGGADGGGKWVNNAPPPGLDMFAEIAWKKAQVRSYEYWMRLEIV